jgi:hypothetical protein
MRTSLAAALLLLPGACASGPDPEELSQAVLERAAFLMGQQNAALGGRDPRALEVIESDLSRLAKDQWPVLLGEAGSKEPDRRSTALFAIGYAGTREAVGALVAATSDQEESVRIHAIAALGTPGLPDVPSEPFLRLLKDESPACRTAVLFAIRRGGLLSRLPVLKPAVLSAFSDRLSDVRNEAAITAGHPGFADAVAPLQAGPLKDADPVVRRNGTIALGRIGVPARPATPALVEALRDEDTRVVEGAWKSLCVLHDKDLDRSYTKWRDWVEDETRHHYVCPEHPEGPQALPGECGKCARPLERRPKEGARKGLLASPAATPGLYECPDHPEVVTSVPARCGKAGCGKDLAAKRSGGPVFACPDHPEVQTSTPARCGKAGCGKDLAAPKR